MKSNTGTSADYLTQGDIASDKHIRDAIKRAFPDDQIITEETVEQTENIDRTKPTWIIDPIDGTKNYATGGSIYGILIGRCEQGEPTL
jgi:myo-inositol-1(or 4)-monophosphatase